MRKYVAFKQNITAVIFATKCICGYDMKKFQLVRHQARVAQREQAGFIS